MNNIKMEDVPLPAAALERIMMLKRSVTQKAAQKSVHLTTLEESSLNMSPTTRS
jgi:hypothetical protein